MDIKGWRTAINRRSIVVKGWANVGNLLQAHAEGRTRSAFTTTDVTARDMGQAHGGMGAALFVLGGALQAPAPSFFVNGILAEAQPAVVRGHGSWSRHYDYDAMGTSFFKTSVDIDRVGPDMFAVGICAAFVGDEPEDELAAFFGTQRAVASVYVGIDIASEADQSRFCIDGNVVAAALSTAVGKNVSGADVAKALNTDRQKIPCDPDGRVQVELSVHNATPREKFVPYQRTPGVFGWLLDMWNGKWGKGSYEQQWSVENAVVFGGLGASALTADYSVPVVTLDLHLSNPRGTVFVTPADSEYAEAIAQRIIREVCAG